MNRQMQNGRTMVSRKEVRGYERNTRGGIRL